MLNRNLRYLGWLALPCDCPRHHFGACPRSLRRALAWGLLAMTDTPLPRSYLHVWPH